MSNILKELPIKDATLYVVATPIGNLSDLSDRQINTLKEVDLIAAEDTRVTRKLLDHLNINTKMISLQKYNEAERVDYISNCLDNHQSVAIVSDAGTPAISDPGAFVVHQLSKSVPVVPIPGPSAVLALMSASGFLSDTFEFIGFLSKKESVKTSQLKGAFHHPVVFFESGKRIIKTVNWIQAQFSIQRFVIAKELSKRHEKIWWDLDSFLNDIDQDSLLLKGEWALAIQFEDALKSNASKEWVDELVHQGFSKSQILWIGQKYHDYSRNDLYPLVHGLK